MHGFSPEYGVARAVEGRSPSSPVERLLFRAIRNQRLVKAGCCGLVEAFKEVAVAVEGNLDRRMPEPGLDDLWVLTLGDEHGDMGVAKIVESQRLTH